MKPAVIGVQTKTMAGSTDRGAEGSPMAPPLPQLGPRRPGVPRTGRKVSSQGSGFFISPDGYAVTNNHVVEGSATAEIQTDDRQSYTAKVVGTDPISDLALLKVDGRNDFPFVKLADKMPRVGDWVVAVGNPFGLGGTVTAGIVSARERNIGVNSYEGLVQIDAPINKGDSGGPSFNLDGNVIGVNTMIFSPSGGSIGIAFAVPADTVKTVIPQLRDKGAVTRGWLGVQVQSVTSDIAEALGLQKPDGALIVDVQAGSPAAKAAIAAGDIITSLDGVPIRDDLSRKIGAVAPGTTVKLAIVRNGKAQTVTAVLGETPAKRQTGALQHDEQPAAHGDQSRPLGLELAPASTVPGAGQQGVVVTKIDPEGRAADRGFEAGDVILEVGGQPVRTASDVYDAMSGARKQGRHNVMMRLKSGDATRFVAIPAVAPRG